ncbi:MAG: sugar phosphate isomerase/epimerase family protein [Planctomycetota bacterium]
MELADRLAVCSWSLQPGDVAELLGSLDDVGIRRVQLHLDPFAEDGWDADALGGIDCVSGMVTCVGEDYSTIAAIHRTGGVVPDETWPATRDRMAACAPIAQKLGIKLVTFHAGFIPDDTGGALFAKLRERIAESADIFTAAGAEIALETGQESAATLNAFLDALGRDDVGVNFDPANMLLYGSGDPIEALRALRPRVKQVHLKDAIASGEPGQWGSEVPVGEGEVDWPAFFAELADYHGPLPIEREAGEKQVEDIRTAATFVGNL